MAVPASAIVLVFWSVAAMAGLVAIVVLAADPRRQANRWLATYLGLEALSFVLVGVGGLLDGTGAAGERAPGGGTWGSTVASLARVLSIAGTGALVYLASVFPRHRGVRTHPAGAALLALAVVGLLGVEVTTRAISTAGDPLTLASLAAAVYVAGAYLAADVLLLRSFRDEPGGVMGEQVRIVATGVVVATVPWIANLATDVLVALAARVGDAAAALVELTAWPLLLWALFLGLLRGLPRRRLPGLRRGQLPSLQRVVAAAFGLFTVTWVLGHVPNLWTIAGAGVPAALADVPGLAALFTLEVRWAVLAAAMLVGFSRHGALGFDEPAWRTSLASVGTIGAFGVVGATGAILGPWWGAAVAAAAVALVAVGAARVGAAGSDPALQARRLSAYRSKLQEARRGDVDPSQLEQARRRLGVTREEHDVLSAVVDVEADGEAGRAVLDDRFEVVERVGSGGSGTVYRVRDTQTGAQAALKRLHPGIQPRRSDDGSNELEVARRVSHPHVVAIHEVLDLDRGAAILLEFAPNGSLADRLDASGPLDADPAAGVLAQALEGLAALHEAGIVHGDVKPANLLLDAEDRVKIADFGIAQADGGATRSRTQGAGTPAYMAPERRGGGDPTPASDVYGAAVTALELVTGRSDPEEALREAPDPWQAWLEPALAEEASGRYEDAAAMREAMRQHGIG